MSSGSVSMCQPKFQIGSDSDRSTSSWTRRVPSVRRSSSTSRAWTRRLGSFSASPERLSRSRPLTTRSSPLGGAPPFWLGSHRSGPSGRENFGVLNLYMLRQKYISSDPRFSKLSLLDTQIVMLRSTASLLHRKSIRLKWAVALLAVAVILVGAGLGLD